MNECKRCHRQLMSDEGVRVTLTRPTDMHGMMANGRYVRPKQDRKEYWLCDECASGLLGAMA